MKTVYINTDRGKSDKQTLGTLTTEGFTCKTIELPWKNNANNISCIPSGKYQVKWTQSPRMSREKGVPVFTYEVQNVPKRAGIRIHPANYSRQLLGCIALGAAHKDIDLDGLNDVVHSGNTCKAFAEFMNKEDFILIITNGKKEPTCCRINQFNPKGIGCWLNECF